MGGERHDGAVPNEPRPTLRCLREDLTDDWGDVRHRRAVEHLDACPPLHRLDHPLVRHAVATFGDAESEANRESISGLYDPMWYKLKTGRWRGAVFIDEAGQAWLCAAGRRYGGESKDFYPTFMREITALGSKHFLPTSEDSKRLARERAEERLEEWESSVHTLAVQALKAAAIGEVNAFVLDGLAPIAGPLGVVTVEVARIEDGADSIGEIIVTVEPGDWSSTDLLERAEIVVLAAICADEESWVPSHAGAQRIYSVTDSIGGLDRTIERSAEPDRSPGQTQPGARSHYAHKQRLADSYVEGRATRALCGVFFVPHRSPEGLETCATCEVVLRRFSE